MPSKPPTPSSKTFLGTLYTIGASLFLFDILVWTYPDSSFVYTIAAMYVVLLLTGTIMSFNSRVKPSKNFKKITWYFMLMMAQVLVTICAFIYLINVALSNFFFLFDNAAKEDDKRLTYTLSILGGLRIALIAIAAVIVVKMDTTNDHEECPRVNSFARVVVAFFGIAGVLTRSIWLFMAAVNDRKMGSIYSIISWICIGGILSGIIFGFVLKVKDSDAKYL